MPRHRSVRVPSVRVDLVRHPFAIGKLTTPLLAVKPKSNPMLTVKARNLHQFAPHKPKTRHADEDRGTQ